jgi:hypothetical protein
MGRIQAGPTMGLHVLPSFTSSMIIIEKPLPDTEITQNRVVKVTSFQNACRSADIEKACHPEIFKSRKGYKINPDICQRKR